MFGICRRLFAPCDSKSVDRYLAHLFLSAGQEVTPLADILPTPKDPAEEVIKFHSLLVERMLARGNPMIGVHVMPKSSDAARIVKAQQPLLSPIFKSLDTEGPRKFSLSSLRCQYVETVLCVSVHEDSSPLEMFPAIEFSGSRYTYFAPHDTGLAADLGGLVTVVRGNALQWNEKMFLSSNVLSKDGEPVRVGCAKETFEDFCGAFSLAVEYSRKIGAPLQRNSLVVVNGLHQRFPVSKGTYDANFGPFGTVECTIE